MKSLTFKLCVLVITLPVCCPICLALPQNTKVLNSTFEAKPISLVQQSSANENVPEGWKKINAKGLFTFYLPPSAWDTGFMALDEYYQEWRIGRMRFKVVYEPMGWLSYDRRQQRFGTEFKESVIEVGGRKAYLCDYSGLEKGRRRYYTDLFVGEWPQGQVKLWMQADTARPADLEIAKKIFRTVEFLKP